MHLNDGIGVSTYTERGRGNGWGGENKVHKKENNGVFITLLTWKTRSIGWNIVERKFSIFNLLTACDELKLLNIFKKSFSDENF